MLAKEEAGMDLDGREEGLSKRVCRRKRKVVHEADFIYQRRRTKEIRSSKKKRSDAQELLWNSRLIKIELDAAQALADFSRLAHLPGHQCPSDLKWFQRRKRTPRSAQKMVTDDAYTSTKAHLLLSELCTNELDSTTSLSHGDKESPLFDSRAESPSSPLLCTNQARRAVFVSRGFASTLPIERDSTEAMQKPIKTEVEDLKSDSLHLNFPAKQKLLALKAQFSLCSLKKELADNLLNLTATEVNVAPLANVTSQLVESKHDMGIVVTNKTKSALTEDDKEARRLRRIQANRESARQTIRKKQKLCEELRRQAASMASENDGMKQKRDMLLQELCFLRGQNYQLKVQLDPGASSYLGSREGLQVVNSPAWQAPSVPCTYAGFPSHVFGWPRIMRQERHAPYSADPLTKEDTAGENLQKMASRQWQVTSQIVPGIPASDLGVEGLPEPSSNPHFKDVFSLTKFSLEEERSCNTEARSSGDADTPTTGIHNISGKEIGLGIQAEPELETSIQARGLVSWHTAGTPLRGDSGLLDKYSTFRAAEHGEHYMDLKAPLAVTRVSSYPASRSSMPMNGQGFASSCPWRMPHVTPTVAAEARKRRKELTRNKRLLAKASKLTV